MVHSAWSLHCGCQRARKCPWRREFNVKRTACMLALVFASAIVAAPAADMIIQLAPKAFAQQTPPTPQTTAQLPSYPLKFGVFVARFDPGGTFTLQGQGWPSLNGNWKKEGSAIEFLMSSGPGGCDGSGRYQFRVDGKLVGFDLVSDECVVGRMI